MSTHARFWNLIAAKYARQPVADEAAYQQKLAQTRELFTPDSVVFEFGCGTGSTAISHAPHVGGIRAIDVSTKMIDIARAKADAANVRNVSFEVADIDEVEVADESCDVVMAHSILHLLTDRRRNAAIAKSFAMLRPGGYFVSSTLCMGDSAVTRVIAAVVSLVSWIGLLPYVNSASSTELVKAITDAGFEVRHVWRPQPNAAWFVIARKSSAQTQAG